MKVKDIIKRLTDFHMGLSVVVEINGKKYYIKEIYKDSLNPIIKLEGVENAKIKSSG